MLWKYKGRVRVFEYCSRDLENLLFLVNYLFFSSDCVLLSQYEIIKDTSKSQKSLLQIYICLMFCNVQI